LIEFSIAAAVATAAISATIATVISTGKTGREIEVLTQAQTDANQFAQYENLLHQMGGANSGYGPNIGDLAGDYVRWINQNYPVLPNGLVTLQSFTNPLTAGVSNGVLEVGNLGTAYGYPQTPTPGTYVWSATDQGAGANPMAMELTYAHAQAFVSLGQQQQIFVAPAANQSDDAEAVSIFLIEDPGTGIVSVSPVYNFGTVDFNMDGLGQNANPLAAGTQLILNQTVLNSTNGSVNLPAGVNAAPPPGGSTSF